MTSLAARVREQLGDDAPDMAAASRITGVLSSRIDSLDVAIGVGGYPEGRVTFLHGPESTGKSGLALMAAAECQARGGAVLYLDFENKINVDWAQKLGVNIDDMLLEFPETIEAGFKLSQEFVEALRGQDADAPALVVWDSLHAGEAKKAAARDLSGGNYGDEAQAYSRGFRRIVAPLRRTRGVFIGISQVRMSIDGMGNSREKAGVGRATLFYASVIVALKSTLIRGSTTRADYYEVAATLLKNNVGRDRTKAKWDFIMGEGVDQASALLQAAVAVGLARGPMPGGYYELTIPGSKKPQKIRQSALAKWHQESIDTLRKAVRALVGQAEIEPVSEDQAEEEGEE